jgi:hypothetical protein
MKDRTVDSIGPPLAVPSSTASSAPRQSWSSALVRDSDNLRRNRAMPQLRWLASGALNDRVVHPILLHGNAQPDKENPRAVAWII